jgi:hypothetical protein
MVTIDPNNLQNLVQRRVFDDPSGGIAQGRFIPVDGLVETSSGSLPGRAPADVALQIAAWIKLSALRPSVPIADHWQKILLGAKCHVK